MMRAAILLMGQGTKSLRSSRGAGARAERPIAEQEDIVGGMAAISSGHVGVQA